MSYRCLADFLEELGHAGEFARVEAAVSPLLEAAEVTHRMAGPGGACLLFGRVSGHDMPVVTNLLGTEARIAKALGAPSVEDVAQRIAELLQPAEPEGWLERIKPVPGGAMLAGLPPRRIRNGACQQVVRLDSDVDLDALPALQSAPDEAGRTITAAVTVTADPETHRQATGRFDLPLPARDRLTVCWADDDAAARLLLDYRRRSERMPLAAVLGGDPAVLLAAASPVPEQLDTFALAGLFRQKPLDLVDCRSVDLQVPADAEIVIEGYVDPAEPMVETGPRCTGLGHYSAARPAVTMHVTAVTHRANSIFPAMVPGRLPNEASVVRGALSRVFLPLVKMAVPDLVDYDLPPLGAARQWLTLSIAKSHAGQARRVASAVWGLRALMFAKFVVIVDDDVDVRDPQDVLAAIVANVDPGRDVFRQQGPPDPEDVVTPPGQLGHRMAIDATRKLPGEHVGPWPQRAVMGREVCELVSGRWEQYGLGPAKD